jgi:Kef-type K+ transport system membrane component KefB
MTQIQKRVVILLAVILIGAVLGRLALRSVLNLLVGGTLFGGNFL